MADRYFIESPSHVLGFHQWRYLGFEPSRRIIKSITSKMKKMGTSKRQRRDDDPNDDDYQPDPSFQAFEQHIHTHMYPPLMTSLQSVQQSLHDDIAALDTRFDDLPTSEQHQRLVERQERL
ncbi:hypothetical protein C2845_PM03G32290 [Panicum miliaceum]|uniref:Uncharacterized protein n=1 Tax=Panicum miliaceum TaxID=4540 RepID=A0A3L6T762_PANMI|nr:hypothetical protein C2845_PM03G32290 [Panicum miliaceum]